MRSGGKAKEKEVRGGREGEGGKEADVREGETLLGFRRDQEAKRKRKKRAEGREREGERRGI